MPLPIYVPELVYAQYAPPAFVPMLQIHLPEPAYDHCAPSSFAPRPHSTPPLKTTASFADLYPDHREHGIIHEHYAPSSFAPRLHSTPPKFSAPKTTAPSTDFYPDHREHAISHDHCTSSFASLLHSPSPEFSAAQSTDFYPHHGNHATSPAKSDHSAYIDLYSTPGPGYRTVPPVYFDSPTEDPSDSDPMMEPAYELDSLDFRWAPFIQKGDNGNQNRDGDVAPAPQTPPPRATVTVNNGGDDYYYETRVEPEGEDDVDGQLYASINLGNERSPMANVADRTRILRLHHRALFSLLPEAFLYLLCAGMKRRKRRRKLLTQFRMPKIHTVHKSPRILLKIGMMMIQLLIRTDYYTLLVQESIAKTMSRMARYAWRRLLYSTCPKHCGKNGKNGVWRLTTPHRRR
ncbi:hypothetical protein K438DRAFT_146658 [Mycena galopus ATCC 62051]|nr:hypothetical protein K438DRAFT_146658 [Mycena galopus ATCC 62051]